jgi:hypoxanthine-DNA glycosylase
MTAPETQPHQRCFAPVADARTRLLILGSLPGEQSLKRGQYYGNPQNKFWMLMSAVLGAELVPLSYAARLQTLQDHGVGLWDVVAEAKRSGSLDSAIRAHASNDLLALAESLPALRTIAFNGQTAARLGRKQLDAVCERWSLFDLPSSSPAHTLAYGEKLNSWIALRRK